MRLVALPAGAVLVASAVSGCGDASGCDDFNPSSQRREVGESGSVTIDVHGQTLGQLDFAGAYWVTDTTIPAADGDEVDGIATLTRAQFSSGVPVQGAVVVVIDGGTIVEYSGPIGCM